MKSLSYLIETELKKAEVIIAAKSVTDKLQQMAESLAKLDANDVMPLGDAMREVFGGDASEAFEQKVSEALRGLIEQVRNARNSISDHIESLESGEPMNDLNTTGSEDLFPDDAAAAPENDEPTEDFGEEEPQDEPKAEEGGDDIDLDDLFSGSEDEASPSGRMRKESFASRRPRITESLKIKMVSSFKTLVKEGHSTASAISVIGKATGVYPHIVANAILGSIPGTSSELTKKNAKK